MAISFHNALGISEQALKLRAERADILSGNLANIDTPNYKARDFDFQSALREQMQPDDQVRLTATEPGHIGFGGSDSMSPQTMYRIPNQPSIDGNTVEEHVEHAEFMKNSLEFQVAFTLLNGDFKGLTKAIRGD